MPPVWSSESAARAIASGDIPASRPISWSCARVIPFPLEAVAWLSDSDASLNISATSSSLNWRSVMPEDTHPDTATERCAVD